jgi:hypothetical protein
MRDEQQGKTPPMIAPDRYRKKPVVIDALQWDGHNLGPVLAFCNGDASYEQMAGGDAAIVIKTLEGRHIASVGDFIIKGVKGEFYPCKPDIFGATYEPDEPRAVDATLIQKGTANA